MADYHGIHRPGGGTPHVALQDHDRWAGSLLTGRLELTYRTSEDQAVSPGTGNLVRTEDSRGQKVVAAEVARRSGVPVLPGSGIKGAVRTTYELLSNSCDPMDGDSRCKKPTKQKGKKTKDKRCEACRLFGGMDYQGRLSFGDAVPASAEEVTVRVEWVPIPFTPSREKTDGDFRFYELSPHSSRGGIESKEMAREMVEGTFHGELHFTNLSCEEMGRLLVCLGLGGERAPRFLLRLGGARYDGWGGVEVGVGRLLLATSALRRETYGAEELDAMLKAWHEAIDDSWFRRYGSALEKLAALHTPHGEGQ